MENFDKIILHNKFKVTQIVKTKSEAFKDLNIGDIVDISLPLIAKLDTSPTQRMQLYINKKRTYISTLEFMIHRGFRFEEIKSA